MSDEAMSRNHHWFYRGEAAKKRAEELRAIGRLPAKRPYPMTTEQTFVEKLRALPERERLIWCSIRILGKSKSEMRVTYGISDERIDELLVQVDRRIGLA